jgi:dCTP deaminase
MILPAQHLRDLDPQPVRPFNERALHKASGMTYGLGPAGYDVRIAQTIRLAPGSFALASTIEKFTMRPDVIGFVHDKSTLARKGLTVQNTVIEPGWHGFLTLELTNHGYEPVTLESGTPVAQVIFHLLAEPTDAPYAGRYQNQLAGPQPAILAQPGDAI